MKSESKTFCWVWDLEGLLLLVLVELKGIEAVCFFGFDLPFTLALAIFLPSILTRELSPLLVFCSSSLSSSASSSSRFMILPCRPPCRIEAMADFIKYFFPIKIELFIELPGPLAQFAFVNTTLEDTRIFCGLCGCLLEAVCLRGLPVCFCWRTEALSQSIIEVVEETVSSMGRDREIRFLLCLVNRDYSPAEGCFTFGADMLRAASASLMACRRMGCSLGWRDDSSRGGASR